MSKMQSALRHHLGQIAEAELVTQIRPHAKDDHLAIEVPPSKQLLNVVQFAHRRPSTIHDHCARRAGAVCARANFATFGLFANSTPTLLLAVSIEKLLRHLQTERRLQ